MLLIIILSASVIIQFAAAICALRVIKTSGKIYAWILISTALILMGVRRLIPLVHLIFVREDYPIDITLNEIVGLAISILMLLGVLNIKQIFNERKQKENALRESERRLNEAQRVGRLGSWDWDAVTDTIIWSEEYYRIYGFDPKQKPPGYEDHLKVYTPGSAARLDAAVKKSMQTGEPYELDLEYTCPDGSHRWVTARGEIKRGPDGSIIGLRGTALDITERKRLDDMLRKNEARLEEAQRVAQIGCWELDLRTNKLFWSDEIYRIFELDPAMFGATYEAFLNAIHPEDRDLVDKAYERSLENKEPYSIDHRLLMKDGRIKVVHERCETYYDEQGAPVRSIGTVQDITERKRIEEEVKHQSDFIQDVFNAIPDPFYVIDADTYKIIMSNLPNIPTDSFCYAVSHSRTKPCEESGTGCVCPLNEIKATRQPVVIEHVHEYGDKVTRIIEVHGYPIFEDDGKLSQIIEYCVDITERKQIENTLFENEEKYRSLFDNARDAILVADTETGFILDCNHSAEILLGRKKDEIIGMHQSKLHPEESLGRKTFQSHVKLVKAEESEEIIRKDGSVVPVRISASVFTIGGRKIMLGIFQDISEQVRLQNQIIESKERFRALTECFSDYIWEIDLNGVITYCSPQAEDHIGKKISAICGMKLIDIVIEEDKLLLTQFIKEQIKYPRPFKNFECRARGRDMDARQISISGMPIFDKQGKLTGYRGINSDITQHKRLEDQLSHSEKMRAIGQLAGGIAHDFNNQLTGILGYSELLSLKLKDETLKQYSDIVVQAAKRSAELIQKLLAFARKGKVLSIPVSIHGIIDEVVSLLEHTIDKKITIIQNLKADRYTVIGDPTQIQNAFLNIGVNARDAMPNGGELIFDTSIVVLGEEYCKNSPHEINPGTYIQICISDTGTGMPDDIKKRIFEPFFTTKEHGTGMGLAAAYGIIKDHHGSISVYSELEHGTVFKIYLPLAEKIFHENEKEKVDHQHLAGNGIIMVVDDEAMVRSIAEYILMSIGYKVILCENGEDAIRTYRKFRDEIDLVILDMIMPKLGGRETFRALKEINPQVKAILASGYSLNGEAQSIIKEGVISFIQKPFSASALSRVIAETMNK